MTSSSSSKPFSIRRLLSSERLLKPTCRLCHDRATNEILLEVPNYYGLNRFCDPCLAKIGYEIPEE